MEILSAQAAVLKFNKGEEKCFVETAENRWKVPIMYKELVKSQSGQESMVNQNKELLSFVTHWKKILTFSSSRCKMGSRNEG